MRYALFFAVLLSAFAARAGELRLELEGKGMAGNQIRVAVYSANAPEQFPCDEKFYRGMAGIATRQSVAYQETTSSTNCSSQRSISRPSTFRTAPSPSRQISTSAHMLYFALI